MNVASSLSCISYCALLRIDSKVHVAVEHVRNIDNLCGRSFASSVDLSSQLYEVCSVSNKKHVEGNLAELFVY